MHGLMGDEPGKKGVRRQWCVGETGSGKKGRKKEKKRQKGRKERRKKT